MKFKDKDGNVFNLENGVEKFCDGRDCDDCPLWKPTDGVSCIVWTLDHPAEAARLMGYEVVEEERDRREASMDKQKPLADWTLGELKEYCHDNAGRDDCGTERCLFSKVCDQIDGGGECVPGDWDLTDRSRFTEQEVADAKVLARALLATGFRRNRYEDIFALSDTAKEVLLDSSMFPSIRPGESVGLGEIVGEVTNER